VRSIHAPAASKTASSDGAVGETVPAQPFDGGYVNAHPSGSLYDIAPAKPDKLKGRVHNPILEQTSLTAVPAQDPRVLKVHDHVTIIIREQSTTTSESTLETEKEFDLDAGVSAFPHLTLKSLLKGQLRQSDTDQADLPRATVDATKEFEGEGEYERRDTMTTRLTARVVDVKPNGMIVLEARTQIRNDDEVQTITVTGSCHPEAVGIDNTVLSTQLFDLRIDKNNTGELRETTRKGLLTKVLELIFNF